MRVIYLICGFIFLGCGAIGAFLPLVPTTPFLLLAVFFFARSSEKWHSYVLNHRIFGKYLRDYQKREMSTKNKINTIFLMWMGMFLGAWLSGFRLVAVITLIIIGTGVTMHLISLKNPMKE